MSLDLVERELTEVGIFEDRRTVPLNTYRFPIEVKLFSNFREIGAL